MMLRKIISGGQAGSDQTALDVAIKLGIHPPWGMPKGRLTENSFLPHSYKPTELPITSFPHGRSKTGDETHRHRSIMEPFLKSVLIFTTATIKKGKSYVSYRIVITGYSRIGQRYPGSHIRKEYRKSGGQHQKMVKAVYTDKRHRVIHTWAQQR